MLLIRENDTAEWSWDDGCPAREILWNAVYKAQETVPVDGMAPTRRFSICDSGCAGDVALHLLQL